MKVFLRWKRGFEIDYVELWGGGGCGLLVLACFLSFVIFCPVERFHVEK